jgi:hypothetical protein
MFWIDEAGTSAHSRGIRLSRGRTTTVLCLSECVDIRSAAKGLEAVAEFPPVGTYAFADQVFAMLKGGFLNATSVGFEPIDSQPLGTQPGKRYTKQRLLEFSIVRVPSNPDALVHREPQSRVWTKTLHNSSRAWSGFSTCAPWRTSAGQYRSASLGASPWSPKRCENFLCKSNDAARSVTGSYETAKATTRHLGEGCHAAAGAPHTQNWSGFRPGPSPASGLGPDAPLCLLTGPLCGASSEENVVRNHQWWCRGEQCRGRRRER